MQRRALGQTGIHVSALGLGTVKFGRTKGLKYAAPATLPTDQEIHELLDTAVELGIDLLDTAPAYGTSEHRLGEILRQRPDRDRWIISTKAGEEFSESDSGHKSWFDFSPRAVRASVERSLHRLRRDALDAVLLHSDGRDLQALDAGGLEALLEYREKGAVRAVGASVKTVEGGRTAVERGCDVVMVTLNAQEREMLPVITLAAERGCGVFIKKPLASGRASDPGEAIAAAASTPGVTSVIAGTTSPTHLRANAARVR